MLQYVPRIRAKTSQKDLIEYGQNCRYHVAFWIHPMIRVYNAFFSFHICFCEPLTSQVDRTWTENGYTMDRIWSESGENMDKTWTNLDRIWIKYGQYLAASAAESSSAGWTYRIATLLSPLCTPFCPYSGPDCPSWTSSFKAPQRMHIPAINPGCGGQSDGSESIVQRDNSYPLQAKTHHECESN